MSRFVLKVRAPRKIKRRLSKGLQDYMQTLRTVRVVMPYENRYAQQLASKIYRSGVDPNSISQIVKSERRD